MATSEKIPEFKNEVGENPVTAIDLVMRDGVILRFKLPLVQQSRVMVAMGRLLASLNVELDIELENNGECKERMVKK